MNTDRDADSTIKAAVYSPPAAGLPYLVVILNPENEVVVARAVSSAGDGQRLIAEYFTELKQHPI